MMSVCSLDTRALLLLCSSLFPSDDVSPLNVRELGRLGRSLAERGLTFEDLLDGDAQQMLGDMDGLGLDPHRLAVLLNRQQDVDALLARCIKLGVWVLGRHDADYPELYNSRLGISAPPLLYGIGSLAMLSAHRLAVVGSKRADQQALDVAAAIAQACAEDDIIVVSGGAEGVDTRAMMTALAQGGRAVAVLSHGLALAAGRAEFQQPLAQGRLLLLSPYEPDAHFTVGRAMGRNKLIYSLCDWALVIRADEGRGGTWAGAQEALRKKWCPLFVSSDVDAAGNHALIARGALSIAVMQRAGSLCSWLDGYVREAAH